MAESLSTSAAHWRHRAPERPWWARWAVVDVTTVPLRARVRTVAYAFTKAGARALVERFENQHRDCPDDCSTYWHYEVRRA